MTENYGAAIPKSCGGQLRYWFGRVPGDAQTGFCVGKYFVKRTNGEYDIYALHKLEAPLVTLPTLDIAAAWLDLTS